MILLTEPSFQRISVIPFELTRINPLSVPVSIGERGFTGGFSGAFSDNLYRGLVFVKPTSTIHIYMNKVSTTCVKILRISTISEKRDDTFKQKKQA